MKRIGIWCGTSVIRKRFVNTSSYQPPHHAQYLKATLIPYFSFRLSYNYNSENATANRNVTVTHLIADMSCDIDHSDKLLTAELPTHDNHPTAESKDEDCSETEYSTVCTEKLRKDVYMNHADLKYWETDDVDDWRRSEKDGFFVLVFIIMVVLFYFFAKLVVKIIGLVLAGIVLLLKMILN
ncbi:hypothetical protein B0J11DRAFT_508449 [Dendryphion nanum]|uniref:Uncharacterized protein n=1 Tax=Dendryphion nanum TaxID=256645 RepID=A0A9P9DI57_9PLEO|nr:hypothetical protein B0J11DRAFT_508449 [Dendryphion nanum]